MITKDNSARIPQPGEHVILADGRRFVLREFDGGARGWWFRADSLDGRSVLQGNLLIAWDEHTGAWRPAFDTPSQAPSPPLLTFTQSRGPEPSPPYIVRDRAKQV